MKITICASMSAYERFIALARELEGLGHSILVPDVEFGIKSAKGMSVGHYFETRGGVDAFPPGHEVWKKKGDAIRKHFRKIDESEAILVANYEKKGVEHYIGANTFLEIGYAFGRGKKIFILNELPKPCAYMEEILGMQPKILAGDIRAIS